MNIRNSITPSILAILLSLSSTSSALTIQEFTDICEASQGDCTLNPMLQAYIGGALDLVAVLDEETAYLQDIYCKSPSEIFITPVIIQYMLQNQEYSSDKNVMLLLVRYLEEQGKC